MSKNVKESDLTRPFLSSVYPSSFSSHKVTKSQLSIASPSYFARLMFMLLAHPTIARESPSLLSGISSASACTTLRFLFSARVTSIVGTNLTKASLSAGRLLFSNWTRRFNFLGRAPLSRLFLMTSSRSGTDTHAEDLSISILNGTLYVTLTFT